MVSVKLPKMNEDEIKNLLENKSLCRIAFIEDDYPYISPFQYVYYNNCLYFHFTDYGKKKNILLKNGNVCVSIEEFAPDLTSYQFISIQGNLKLIEDVSEKTEIIRRMVNHAKKNYSTSFLSAHGFESKKGWDNFSVRDQLIYKLEEVGSRIALKSIS